MILDLLLTGFIALGKILIFLEHQFFHLCNGNNNYVLYELIYGKRGFWPSQDSNVNCISI